MAEPSIWTSNAALADRLRYYLGPGSDSLVQMLMLAPSAVPGGGDAMDIYGSSSALADAVSNLDPKEMLLQGGNLAASIGMVGLPGNKSMVDEAFEGIPSKKPGEWVPADIYGSDYTYSPSQLAALNLRQRRGPYEQLRAAMIQTGGAKADELAWTGADRAFAGKEVTADEVAQYLSENYPVSGVSHTAQGTLGSPSVEEDYHEALGRYIENNLENEIENLMENVDDEFIGQTRALDLVAAGTRDNVERELTRHGYESIEAYLEQFPNARYDPSTGQIYMDADTWAEKFDWEDVARRGLEQQAQQMDPNELFLEVNGYDAPSFDPEDTQYSGYMTPGGTDYTENFRTYEPSYFTRENRDLNQVRSNDRANTHFVSEDDYLTHENPPTLFHTRSATYPTLGGGSAYHLGEIQSDFAQGTRAKLAKNVERNLKLDAAENRASINRQYGLGSSFDDYDPASIVRPNGTLRENEWGQDPMVDDPDAIASTLADNRMFQTTVEDYPRHRAEGRLSTPNEEIAIQQDMPALLRDYNQSFLDIKNDYGEYPQNLEAYVPFGEDELPLVVQGPKSNMGAAYAADPRRATMKAAEEKLKPLTETADTTLPNAPYMSSTDKWVRQALREEFGRAVAQSGISGKPNAFTLGTGKQAVEMVGGNESGQTGFYDSIVPKNMNDILKKLGPFQLQPTLIGTGQPPGDTWDRVPGIGLTPELIDAVKKKGLPRFSFIPEGTMGNNGLRAFG